MPAAQPHARASRELLRRAELVPQREFHFGTLRAAVDVYHALARWTERLFLAALLAAIVHLAIQLGGGAAGESSLTRGVTLGLALIGVAFPALAASMHGFLGTGDFEGLALRSAGLEARLYELEQRLDRLDPVDTTGVGDLAVEAARLMEGELATWRTVAETRRLEM